MKRSTIQFLLDPKPSDGGGISDVQNATAVAVLERLGLPAELAGEAESGKRESGKAGNTSAETPEQKAEREAAATEEARMAAKVAETGKTADEIAAEEAAEAEAEETRMAAKMEETGKTREEILAEEQAAAAIANEPEFTDEQRAWVTAQQTSQEEALQAAKTEAEEAKAQVAALEQQLEAAGEQPVQIAAIHPYFLIDDAAKLEAADAQLAHFEKWAVRHWDGTEAVEAKGDQPAQPAFTAAQVRERYAELKEVREKILPAARQAIATRKQFEAKARTQYPELFDPKRKEHQVAQNLVRLAPGLKAVLPNIWTVIGDALRGEKLRLAEEKAKAARKPAVKAGATPAPKVPARPAPGARSGAPAAKAKGENVSAQKFMDLGGDRNALVTMLQSANLPTLQTKDH